ncbi:uncharacterized protein LOC117565512 [Drosophila albomicans]|uniref:Uncharacterized protein LOC117565512 n=1 Tax=Drosophila albomicans TaxID=7291 RepID=A0A6P8WAB6_DROAB|nr:uncharacterized protein LOC117565512 [Drosophila albomicans]
MANFIHNPIQQRYYFKKGVAYTEDHIVVKKLFLYNVDNKLTIPDLQKYFEDFGQVLGLQIFPSRSRIGSNWKRSKALRLMTGYVFFAQAKDAAEVLRNTSHTINKLRFSVKPNDSWHQPDAYAKPEHLDEEKSEQSAVLLTLNDHCLEHIMRQLQLPDRIRFARTCNRLRSVYVQASAALNRSISFDSFDGATDWDMRDFFTLSGAHVQHIEGNVPPARCQRLCEYLGQHCRNLRSMRATASYLSTRNMHKLFARTHQLEELQLRACQLLNDGLLALKHLRQLQRLDLSDNRRLTGLNMNLLPPSIVSLTLVNCNGFHSQYMAKICRALPKLRQLNLHAVYTITTGFQQLVSSNCGNAIEEVIISSNPMHEYEYIAKLPRLKKLVLYYVEPGTTFRPMLLTWLVQHKAQQLQHFEVRGQNCINGELLVEIGKLVGLRILALPHNSVIGERELESLKLPQLEQLNLKYWLNLTDAAVLRLLAACPKLQLLHLEECPRLTDNLLHDIIFKLRLQQRAKELQRQLPVVMHVHGSRINWFNVHHPDVTAAKDVLDVTLAPPSSSDLYLVRMPNLFQFDFYPIDEDSFGSEDEFGPDYDPYRYNAGFFSDVDELDKWEYLADF